MKNKRIGAIIVTGLLLSGIGLYELWLGTGRVSDTDQSDQTVLLGTTPALVSDLIPLYPDAEWGTPVATTSVDYGRVTVIQSKPFVDVTDIAAKSTPFTQYYHDQLTKAGWIEDESRAAGGPGASVSVYVKDGQVVVFSFESVFKVVAPDAPSQCPCNVTFTLMSGTSSMSATTIPTERYSARVDRVDVVFEQTDYTKYRLQTNDLVRTGELNTERGYGDDIDATVYVLNWKEPTSQQIKYVRLIAEPNHLYYLDSDNKIIKGSVLTKE